MSACFAVPYFRTDCPYVGPSYLFRITASEVVEALLPSCLAVASVHRMFGINFTKVAAAVGSVTRSYST